LNGPGFFAVKTAQGVRYTRDGSFSRSATGALQTGLGEPVLDAKQQAITIPSGTIQVSADGTISAATPDGSSIAGQVGVFDFANSGALVAEGTNRFATTPDNPAIATTATIQQGALEGANSDAIHGSMQLVLVQRQAEMMQKALSTFNNDLDKTAAEELPRI
jgi:flagellar basal-body rod protein FlgF/flagellar basal-body rod protein FlgG